MKLHTSIFASFALLLAGAANATVITAQDNFNNGASGGTGWDGNWQFEPAVKPNKQNPSPVAPASISNSSLVFVGNADNAAVRNLASLYTSDVFFDFTLTYSGALGDNDFVGMWFEKTNAPNIGLKANCGDSKKGSGCSTDLFVRMGGNEGVFLSNSSLLAGQNYQVFGHMYKSADQTNKSYDHFDAWFTLAGSNAVLGTAQARGNSNISSFDTLGFRSANIDGGVTVAVDNVRMGEIPEPGSVALMGLALVGLAAARRRKQK
jgi:hypothetical protein